MVALSFHITPPETPRTVSIPLISHLKVTQNEVSRSMSLTTSVIIHNNLRDSNHILKTQSLKVQHYLSKKKFLRARSGKSLWVEIWSFYVPPRDWIWGYCLSLEDLRHRLSKTYLWRGLQLQDTFKYEINIVMAVLGITAEVLYFQKFSSISDNATDVEIFKYRINIASINSAPSWKIVPSKKEMKWKKVKSRLDIDKMIESRDI